MRLSELLAVVDYGTTVRVKNERGEVIENLHLPDDQKEYKTKYGNKKVLSTYPARGAHNEILVIYVEV